MSEIRNLSRRVFLRAGAESTAALVLGFYLPSAARGSEDASSRGRFKPNAYLEISSDDRITLWVTRSEMGQGVRTTLPMLLAEELEADWEKVRLEQAATVAAFKDIRLRTSGSGSSVRTWMPLRKAGATAREMLLTAASQTWQVERGTCRAERGSVVHAASGRRWTYGKLAEAASHLEVPKDAPLKDARDFRYIGKRVRRSDGPEIVTGRAIYGLDVRVPGMLYAALARSPYLGGKALSWNDAKARAVPGVRDVVPVTTGIATGVAVVAGSTWAAFKARDLLEVEWDAGPNREFSSATFYQDLREALAQPGYKVRHEGDAKAAAEHAEQKLEATYEYPYQAHAPVEPMNCTADVGPDGCEIWVPTQAPHTAQELAAKLLGIEQDKVKVNVTLLGGGFGRRLFCDYVPEAVEISRAVKSPVQVVWSRVEDMRQGFFHPPSVQRITCALDAGGKPVAWIHKCAGQNLSMYGPPEGPANPNHYAEDGSPWGAFDNPYNFPALRVDYVPVESPVPTGPWRAVEYPASVLARECMMDELAVHTGRDPLELRLQLLEPGDVVTLSWEKVDRGRLRRVLQAAAEKSGWTQSLPQVAGRRWGRGLACNVYHATGYIAQVAEVSVGREGDVRVHRIVCTVDCGQVVNLSMLEGQVESGIVWGLSATLHGDMVFRNGAAQQSNYSDFPVLTMDEMPAVEVHRLPSPVAPGGLGEHAVVPVAPAVLNAVFAATGIRLRQVPVRPEALRG